MAEQYYTVPADPQYHDGDIRRIQNSDPVNADDIINPVIEALIGNTAAVKKIADAALPAFGGTLTGNLTLKGSGNFGTQINLGDGDYVHISEPKDDCLEIKAKQINFLASSFPASGALTIQENANATAYKIITEKDLNETIYSDTIALGHSANASGPNSVAIGSGAYARTKFSTALGASANANGNWSMALGIYSIADGTYSIAIGTAPNTNNPVEAIGNYSIALGHKAHASGENSSALGANAVAWDDSTALGANAIAKVASVVIGRFAEAETLSVAIGGSSTAYGGTVSEFGYSHPGSSVAIGAGAHANGPSSIAIGRWADATNDRSVAIGHNATNSNAKSIQLGSETLSGLYCAVALTKQSDERDKTDITPIDDGAVEFLRKIKAIRYLRNNRVGYHYDEETLDKAGKEKRAKYGLYGYDKEAHARGDKKGSRVRVGVIAQEVQRALQEVYGDASYGNLVNDNFFDYDPADIPEDVENQLGVSYENFIPFLIKAVQELAERLEALEVAR